MDADVIMMTALAEVLADEAEPEGAVAVDEAVEEAAEAAHGMAGIAHRAWTGSTIVLLPAAALMTTSVPEDVVVELLTVVTVSMDHPATMGTMAILLVRRRQDCRRLDRLDLGRVDHQLDTALLLLCTVHPHLSRTVHLPLAPQGYIQTHMLLRLLQLQSLL